MIMQLLLMWSHFHAFLAFSLINFFPFSLLKCTCKQGFLIASPLPLQIPPLKISPSLPPLSMGRPPCCDKSNVKRGLWTEEEDAKILAYVASHGTGNWTSVPKKAGLNWRLLLFLQEKLLFLVTFYVFMSFVLMSQDLTDVARAADSDGQITWDLTLNMTPSLLRKKRS